MIERLLLPLSGEPADRSALSIAALLPSKLMYLLRVEQDESQSVSSRGSGTNRPAFGYEDAYLEGIAEELRGAGRDVEVLQSWGDPGTRITEVAADIDCIVMSTHGRGGVERALHGSISDHVVRNAAAPVLLVPHDYASTISRVLVPLDGSASAEAAIPLATQIAAHRAVPMELLRVSEQVDRSSRTYLDGLVGQLRGATLVKGTERYGDVIGQLRAEIQATDLVVMTTRGRHGLLRLLFGSVTDALIQQGRCPILALRSG